MTRTWLITGSSRGLGRALAQAVLAAGDNVVATARRPEQLDDLVAAYPGSARAVALDVTDRAAAARRRPRRGRRVRPARRGRQQRRLRQRQLDRGLRGGRLPRADRDQPVGRHQRHPRGAADPARAGLRPHHPDLVGRRPRHARRASARTRRPSGRSRASRGVLAQEVAPFGVNVTIVEPGGFRTDWAGASMTMHEVRDAYRPTVGQMAEYRAQAVAARRSGQGRAGDPGRSPASKTRRCGSCSAATPTASPARPTRRRSPTTRRWKELTLSTDAVLASQP